MRPALATTNPSIRSFRPEPLLFAHNIEKSVTCMDSKVSYTWTDLLTYLFAYSQICLHLQTGACICSYVNKHYTHFLYFCTLCRPSGRIRLEASCYAILSMKHFFIIEKLLHAKNREALGVSGCTILSVKYCFLYFFHTKVLLTKNRVGRNVQQI